MLDRMKGIYLLVDEVNAVHLLWGHFVSPHPSLNDPKERGEETLASPPRIDKN